MPPTDKTPVKLSLPLTFQQDIFQELRDEDELVVLARGLGLLRVVNNLLHSYDAAGNNLIIIIGAEERENGWIGEALAERVAISGAPKARGLTLVNTDNLTVTQRERMYQQGGILSITSRILIVDLLSKLLSPETITGMVVLHAEKITATSLEAFILRIYRQQNKQGFLKAFSDSPEPLTMGFAPLSKLMGYLFLRRPSLWPRFHSTVAESLEGKKRAEVIELEVPMTDMMKDIQNAIMTCVEDCIGELKRANTDIDMGDWNLDSALHKNFDQIVRRQLEPVWHRTTFKTRQITRDLAELRILLQYLLVFDSISFNKYLDTVLTAATTSAAGGFRSDRSPWMASDAGEQIFSTARRRVYTGSLNDHKQASADGKAASSFTPVLEEQPKWAVLAEVLAEIDREQYLQPAISDDSNGTVLIMGGDSYACRQMMEFLERMDEELPVEDSDGDVKVNGSEDTYTASSLMRHKLRNYLQWRKDLGRASTTLAGNKDKASGGNEQRGSNSSRGSRAPPNKRRRVRGGGAVSAGASRNAGDTLLGDREGHMAHLMAQLDEDGDGSGPAQITTVDPLEDMDSHYALYEMRNVVLVHPYDGDADDALLEETRPSYIIMYEPDSAFIRRVEVYRSSHSDRQVRVYFLYYAGSVEEQRYLSAVRREKDAFTKLIKERASMAVTLTGAADASDDPQEQFLRTINTRIAGGGRVAATAAPPQVVVDVREFRSSLPSLLHARALQTLPCMLTVGDYVLSPDICVERKSVRDLIGSFANGRLYNQAESMLQHYRSPFLLIEFDHGKTFTLEPFHEFTAASGPSSALQGSLNPSDVSDLQSKLVLLTIAFPKLKIIWSSSPYQTAEIFAELKKNQDEPDATKAVMLGLDDEENAEERAFAQAPQDMLRVIPGVDVASATKITLDIESLQALANTEEEALAEMIGKEAARQIRRFFDRSVFDDEMVYN